MNIGKITRSTEPNQEIAIDFAGPFHNSNRAKKYLIVSIDNFSDWPEAMFLHKPTTQKVIEFLMNYIARYGIPKIFVQIREQHLRAENLRNFVNGIV